MFKVILKCPDCEAIMNDLMEMSAQKLLDIWTNLVLTAPLNCPTCPKCHQSTFSDCNSNYTMLITNGEKEVTLSELKSELEFLNNNK